MSITRDELVDALLQVGVGSGDNRVFCTQVADKLLAGPLKPSQRDRVITLLAEVLAGLQVPASLNGPAMLGAAYEPWVELRAELRLFGWPDGREHENALRQILR